MQGLEILKLRLGITSSKRDEYLRFLLESLEIEIKESQGITLNLGNKFHLNFLIDYAVYRYNCKDEVFDMPRHLKWRLHNLYVSEGK